MERIEDSDATGAARQLVFSPCSPRRQSHRLGSTAVLKYDASPAYHASATLLHGTKMVNPELIRTSLRKRPWAPEVGMGCADKDTATLFMALGKAVSAVWSNLPQDVQHQLFEKAVSAQDDATRQRLAVFLHERHFRTTDRIKARAMPEPDSLGG
jgi:hypothetical protein